MRTHLTMAALLGLVGCSWSASEPVDTLDGITHVPDAQLELPAELAAPPGTLTLTSLDNWYAGSDFTVVVSGAQPNARTFLMASLATSGSLACPNPMAPICTDLFEPARLLAEVRADATGVATFTLTLPPNVPGRPATLQAVAVNPVSADTSNTVTQPFWYAGDDDDGDTLTNFDELETYGTDPLLADTDGGGLDDDEEIALGRDPNDPLDDILDTGETGDSGPTGVAPLAGDLLIHEIMPNPNACSDNDGEFVELYNASANLLDLSGVSLSDNGTTVTLPGGTTLAAGDTFTFGKANFASCYGFAADYEMTGVFLGNSGETLTLADAGATTLDTLTYSSAEVGIGISWQRNQSTLTDFCFSTSAIGAGGDLGTPDALNDDCVVDTGDTDTDTGTPVPAVDTIANVRDCDTPSSVGVGSPAHVEGVVTAVRPGLAFVMQDAASTCSGIYVFHGGSVADPTVGDSVAAFGDYTEFSSGSAADSLAEIVVDAVGGDFVTTASTTYGPFAPASVAPGSLVDGYESMVVTVQGTGSVSALRSFGEFEVDYAGTVVIVDDQYADLNTLPNFDVGAEFTDLTGIYGYTFGEYKVMPRTTSDFGAYVEPAGDTGDSAIDTDTGPSGVAPTVGDLLIHEIMPNPNACSDNDGEYLELYNASASLLDLSGVSIADNNATVTLPGGTTLAAGETFTFGKANFASCYGFAADYEMTGVFLGNSGETLTLTDASAATLDTLTYSSGNVGTGVSWQRDQAGLVDFCFSTSAIGAGGDFGTPGALNDDCGGDTGDTATPVPAVDTIANVRDCDTPSTVGIGSPAHVEGVVTAVRPGLGFVLQDAAATCSGIYVYHGGLSADPGVGDSVAVFGDYTEYSSGVPATGLSEIVVDAVGGDFITPSVTTYGPFAPLTVAPGGLTDGHENVVVTVTGTGSVSALRSFGEFEVDYAGTVVIVDDQFADLNTLPGFDVGAEFTDLTGVYGYTFGEYKLMPRTTSDYSAYVEAPVDTSLP